MKQLLFINTHRQNINETLINTQNSQVHGT